MIVALFSLSLCFAATINAATPSDIPIRFGVGDVGGPFIAKEFQSRLDLYRQAGIGILRTDIGWRDREKANGIFQDPEAQAFLQLAHNNSFLLKANIGAFASPPDWFFNVHPDAQLVNEVGLKSTNAISYWFPGLYDLLEQKDDELFAYASTEGLLSSVAYLIVPLGPAGEPLYPPSWTTSEPNKPIRFWFFDRNAQADFPLKMREKYRLIHRANTKWGTHFKDWSRVEIPSVGTQPGPMWRDVLGWYRDTKRAFIRWQVMHYRRLIAKYYGARPAPKLLILVPGDHITAFEMDAAVTSGGGNDQLKMMSDSEFLLDVAHSVDAYIQYTGIPNMGELEYLEQYMRDHKYSLPLWGENAGNKGDPKELDAEVLLNGLYGQEYIGANIFESDRVTPTAQYFDLKDAHVWLKNAWGGRVDPPVSLKLLPVEQGACVYGNASKGISLCMQDDGNLVLSRNEQQVWSSHTGHREFGFCSTKQDPVSACNANFQGDGNLVVRRGDQALWSSNTAGHSDAQIAILDMPPYLKITDSRGAVLWSAVQTNNPDPKMQDHTKPNLLEPNN
jgi:hypothetical protein